ncbi:MAG: DUF2800 domain-containing protein, partial [Lachnospiraceae bacterium]|nr:DUF2800 domain-containing protein [Lachnospiraceae bacterium]
MPDVHAILSASGAARWMNCPPSVILEKKFPDKGSVYAEEGTLAHTLAEVRLRTEYEGKTAQWARTQLRGIRKSEYYTEEMEEHIDRYASLVAEAINEAGKICPDPKIMFEQRLDFSEYVPEGFGTGDVVIIADDMVQVIDLKYGKGVPVSAEGNPQLRLYGIGALLEYQLLYDIRRVRMTIIQPRLDNISTEELTAADLLHWAETDVAPKARLAAMGEGEQTVGPWCQFCKASAVCRARADYNLDLMRHEFKDPQLLEPDEIADILGRLPELMSWAKGVGDYALSQALAGEHYEGWKVVEGVSRRKIEDQAAAQAVLSEAGYESEDFLKPAELKGITELTKLVGKKKLEEL